MLLKQKLDDIIKHCITQDGIEYTMSDFEDFEPYVVFNETVKGNTNRLFMFPPADAGAESYFQNIVPKLHKKNLVLFNNYFLYLNDKFGAEQVNHLTYEKLATEYIRYIKSIQPEGPYYLFGWSFGGILAFEIARQLINIGDIIAKIVLIDAFFYYKKAALKINIQLSEINNINYKYCPLLDNKIFHTNIVLFKALKIVDPYFATNQNDVKFENMYKICKYYVENTDSNHLEDLLKNKKFKVRVMDCNHNNWVHNDLQIINICNELS